MKKVFVKLNNDEKLFFTSDLHIGHRNVIKFCNRPFADVKEMEETIIQNWNSVVSNKDSVFVLGDVLWFPHSGSMNKFFKKLNGKTIYIIPGNHDDFDSLRNDDPNRIVVLSDEVTLYVEIEDKTREIYLSHCPMMTWPHRNKNVPNLFGHIHSGPVSNNDTDNDLPLWPLQYDIGCDNNNYTPVELRDVYKKLENSSTQSNSVFINGYNSAVEKISDELKRILSISKEGFLEDNLKIFINELSQ